MKRISRAVFIVTLLALICIFSACGFSNNTPIDENKGFQVYRKDTNELLKENENVAICSYYDFYFTCKLNGYEVSATSIVMDETSTFVAHSRSIYAFGEGEGNVTISYVNEFGNNFSKTFHIVSSYNNTLDTIYVGNEEKGLSVDSENNVSITGKVFAKYKNGIVRYISSEDPSLTIASSSGKNDASRKVTLGYTENGISKEVSYNVPLSSSTDFQKTTIEQNFQTYIKNGYYSTTSSILDNQGVINCLVLPIWFSDSSSKINTEVQDRNGLNQKEQILQDLETVLFTSPFRAKSQSLASYYYQESLGNLAIIGKVAPWYNAESYSTSTNYFSNASTRSALLKDALDDYKSNNPSDTADYDCVLFFYGTNKYGDVGNEYYAFATHIIDDNYKELANCTFVSALSIYGLDTNDVEDYYNYSDLSDAQFNDELLPNSIVHEFAHLLGAIDMYDDSDRISGQEDFDPAGGLTMQDDNNNSHDLFNQMGMGFVNPYVFDASKYNVGETIDFTFTDSQSSGDCIILTNSWNSNNSIFDEYLLLDLFAETGLNALGTNKLNRYGVRLYHVNAKLYDFDSQDFTSDASTEGAVLPYTNTYGKANGVAKDGFLTTCNTIDLVHLIRRNTTNTNGETIYYHTTEGGKDPGTNPLYNKGKVSSWFKEGDSFSMSEYANQFYNTGLMDDSSEFHWEFTVLSMTQNEDKTTTATIRLTRVE